MNIKKIIIVLVVLFALAFLTYSLGKNDYKKPEKTVIAASIFPVADIAENIVGVKMQVIQVLPNGASPHTYEPTVKDKQQLSSAQALFLIGAELDNWAKDLAEEDTKLINISDSVNLLEDDHGHEEEISNQEEDEHAEFDPHYWLSPLNAKLIAQRIYAEVIQLDAENQAYYQQNLDIYLQQLDRLYTELKAEFMDIENKELITFHSAFAYFAADFNLEIVATIEEFPGKEPTATYLKEVGDIIREHDVNVLFKEPQLSESIVTTMATDYNIEVLTLDPLGGLNDADSYIKLIRYNAQTIRKGLEL